jgi:poly(3-hydroxybutyrate) depolymerase
MILGVSRRFLVFEAGVVLTVALRGSSILAQDLPRGQIVDQVKCVGDPTQTYALYLPSNYSPDRPWSLLVGFHPAARGRAIVETYRAAAEQYGVILAGSNNSRNGPWQVSAESVQAMSADLGQRFAIDPKRFYLTGLSGGARVAMGVAAGTKAIAGVIASSAGYPDNQPRKTVPFAVFGTAGTEDFNYIEMRQLDRALTTPHRVVVFEGGHTLPPANVALEAIEWLELQAMKTGRKARDEALIDRLFDKRQQEIAVAGSPALTVHLIRNLADDFGGLRDVAAAAARAAELSKHKDVKNALARERAEDDAEARQIGDVFALEAGLRDESRRIENLGRLRDMLTRCERQASADADSLERRRARRLLRTITMGAAERVQDAEYLKLLEQYRTPGPRETMRDQT